MNAATKKPAETPRFPLRRHIWCHTGMQRTAAEANKDRPHYVPAEDAEALRKSHAALAAALDECATRFERCCIHSGSDKEFAAHAVEDYRALVKAAKETT